jgi:alkylation response protein AidB-like acyl-CoA dehydrogenase
MSYHAPTQDMLFVINELAGLSELNAFEEYAEITPDVVESILEEAGKFATDILDPINHSGDKEGNQFANNAVTTATGFKEAYAQFAEAGWTGVASSPDYGGQGLPSLVSTAVAEIWKSANMAFSLCPMLTQGAIEALMHHCSDESIRSVYLPKMIEGTWTGTMNLTEPSAGSDLSAVRSKAVPEGDHYRISGQKIFITWGEHDVAENIIHLVLARLPDAPEGVKGISLFVVPKFLVNADGSLGARNDAYCVSIEHKLGINASPTAVIAFGDNEGALGYMVGEPNQGLKYMFTMMNHARLAVGLEGVAISERAYQRALAYAKERIQGVEIGSRTGQKVAIIKHPDVRRMLLTMKSVTEATRAVAYYGAALLDKAGHEPDDALRAEAQSQVDLLIPVVKGWCTEMGVELTSLGIQVHGGMGYIEETGAAQHFRDARIATIYEGTTGIQANDLVGRKVGLDKGVAAQALFVKIKATLADLDTVHGDDFAVIRQGLSSGLEALTTATAWIVQQYAEKNPQAANASSVAYLRLFGYVVGGWQMARAAFIAQQKLQQSSGNHAFFEAKIISTRFYADYMLSQAAGLSHAVTQGSVAILAMSDELF